MEDILIFLAKNYIWFILVSVLLIFALVGYLFDEKKAKEEAFEENRIKKHTEAMKEESIPLIDKPLNQAISDKPVNPTVPKEQTNLSGLVPDEPVVETFDINNK